jgi:hypothetical protein
VRLIIRTTEIERAFDEFKEALTALGLDATCFYVYVNKGSGFREVEIFEEIDDPPLSRSAAASMARHQRRLQLPPAGRQAATGVGGPAVCDHGSTHG